MKVNRSTFYICATLLIALVLLGCAATFTDSREMVMKEQWFVHNWLEAASQPDGRPPVSFLYGTIPTERWLGKWQRSTRKLALDANRTRYTFTWRDPHSGLVIRCDAIDYHDLPAVEWVLHLCNTGKKDTPILQDVRPLDMILPGGKQGFVVHHAFGDCDTAQSFAPIDDTIRPGDTMPRLFSPGGGLSSSENMPYFNFDWHSGGVVLAIGWAGEWQTEAEPQADGALRVRCGQRTTHFCLHPGESVRTPRIVLTFWDGDNDLRGNNLLRQLVFAHYAPRRNGQPVFSPICASVNETAPDGSYERPHLDAIPRLARRGIEVFWSDMDPQQWYPKGYPNGTGTWEVDRKKYPHGLKPIGDAVRAAGMQYLLWFEPERVHRGTRIAELHPEWVMKPKSSWGQLFRLGNPTARRWLTDCIDVQITAARLAWVRWDCNLMPLDFWQANDTPDRQGITEMHHVEGLYAMWTELQRRHPGLLIDVCASGGHRLDIETLSYGMPLWHSDRQGMCDWQTDVANQLQNGGLFRWVPMHGCADWGQEPSYAFRSAMTAGNIIEGYGRFASHEKVPEDTVKRTVAMYHKLRPYMLGDFYPLFPHDISEYTWYGYQFHRPDHDDGYAMLFRREISGEDTQVIHLHGLKPDMRYEVHFEDTPGTQFLSGKALAAYTVTIPARPGPATQYYRVEEEQHGQRHFRAVPERPGSAILYYRAVGK